MEDLNEVFNTVEGLVSIISISMYINETFDILNNFKTEFNINWEFGWDKNGKLNETYNVFFYPTTVIMDNNRKIIKEWIGLTEAKTILKELDKYVDLPGAIWRDPISNSVKHPTIVLMYSIPPIIAMIIIQRNMFSPSENL